MHNNIIQNLLQQQKKLNQKTPNLKSYFIDIFIPQFNTSIPFLPIRCFRDFDLHTRFTEETSDQFKIFLSSGSTGNKRSRHIFSPSALKNYEDNTCKGFSRFLESHHLTKETPIISLVPPSKLWPTSSLAAMMEMFALNNFNVTWCDIDEKKENLISCLKVLPEGSECIIFGTTFHHLMLVNENSSNFKERVQAQFKRLNISIVDTGGTKGRTQAFTLEQTVDALKNFYTTPHFSFFSEYGMCELSSQAWSSQKIHNGAFTCNETLFPFAISIENKQSLPLGEKGFIGFIDLINQESWGALITEDIGFTYAENSFHLLGRGPDASIKGCSLNVRNYFTFTETSERTFLKQIDGLKSELKISAVCQFLKEEKNWDTYSINDFLKIAASIEEPISIDSSFKSKNMLMISAANTPIAWLFPYLIAAHSQAASITIKVPSLRLDDYFAESMILKTKELIQIISSYFPNTKTYIDSNKSIAHTFHEYDIVLTFGTDETLQTISQQIDKQKTAFIGKGDIKNSLTIKCKTDFPQDIVDLCSLWNGRGCLTPVALFCEGDALELDLWCKEFSFQLEKQFSNRYENSKVDLIRGFSHSHNCAYVRGQVKQLGLNDELLVLRGKLTCVVNLTQCSPDELKNFEPDFSFGGAGFVYLFPAVLKDKFTSLKELSILPKINDK